MPRLLSVLFLAVAAAAAFVSLEELVSSDDRTEAQRWEGYGADARSPTSGVERRFGAVPSDGPFPPA